MYFHIVPKLFHLMANKCQLGSIVIPELDFKIESEALSTGRPWPNRNIWIGMAKSRRALNGILFKTNKTVRQFDTVFEWHIENLGVISHRVTNYIEDNEFDMISQDVMFNGGFDKWKSRTHSAYANLAPVYIQPKMESFLKKTGKESHDTWVEYDWGSFLKSREEDLLLHTIESERLTTNSSMFDRMPTLQQAIIID